MTRDLFNEDVVGAAIVEQMSTRVRNNIGDVNPLDFMSAAGAEALADGGDRPGIDLHRADDGRWTVHVEPRNGAAFVVDVDGIVRTYPQTEVRRG